MQQILQAILARAGGHQRFMVAMAGPPGAGKSTMSMALAQELPNSAVLQMDGFHYDNAVLDQLGLRHRKGAPETFDYEGFAVTLRRIRNGEPDVAVPVFDRTMDLARAGAAMIREDVKYVLVEGNYLLLDEAPWRELAAFFDLAVFLEVPRSELYHRLVQRWLDLGRGLEQARHWVDSNDMPNVDRVLGAVGKMAGWQPAPLLISLAGAVVHHERHDQQHESEAADQSG
jgi:pantothenate kinase